jgi:hypothetical protein
VFVGEVYGESFYFYEEVAFAAGLDDVVGVGAFDHVFGLDLFELLVAEDGGEEVVFS